MLELFLFNTISVFIFLLGYFLNLNIIQTIFGFILFFLPAFNLGLTLEAITHTKPNKSYMIVWCIFASPIILAANTYATILLTKNSIDEKNILASFIILLFFTVIIAIFTKFATKTRTTAVSFEKLIIKDKTFWLIALVIICFQIVHFVLYKFIPEADSYPLLVQLNNAVGQGQLTINQVARPFFLSLTLAISYLTNIPFYWIFKILIPLFVSLIFLPFYFESKRLFKNRFSIFFGSLLPFLFPVVSLEILISRPQSIFIVSLVMALYLLSKLLKENDNPKNLYYFLCILLLSMLALKMHEFFFFLIIISFFSTIRFSWKYLMKYKLESFLAASILLILFIPWFKLLGISEFSTYISIFERSLLHPTFRIWFISNYTNVDGSQMGWPGLTWIFYYGYNMGFIIPIVIIYFLIKRKFPIINIKPIQLYLLSFLLFFSIAEIFPRIGLAYLPDRAWLFVSLSCALFLPEIIKQIEIPLKKIVYLCIIVFSFLTSWSLTYAKQGWTTVNEYNAAQFIKNNTPKDSIIISQGGNSVMVNYFANRYLIVPSKDFFLGNNKDSDQIYLKNLPLTLSKSHELNNKKNNIITSIEQKVNSLSSKSGEDLTSSQNEINDLFKQFDVLQRKTEEVKKRKLDKKHPVYILYSNDKFTGLYGSRGWWQEGNFLGLNIQKFNQNSDYTQIYNKNGIFLWKIN